MTLTRNEVKALLRGYISEWRIDPHDAGLVFEQTPAEGIDVETLGDQLDGAGYPELAEAVYKLEQA
jgi:hypothetical protein